MTEKMSRIVRTVVRLATTIILVFAAYIILHGHLTPGGGLQGGAIAATAFALLMISYRKFFKPDKIKLIKELALTGFAIIALAGIGASLMHNFLLPGPILSQPVPAGPNPGTLNTGGILLPLNVLIGLEVLAGLTLIVMYIGGFKK